MTGGRAKRADIDWQRIESAAAEFLAEAGRDHGGVESDLVRLFLQQEQTGRHDKDIGTGPNDTIVTEMPFRFGRADLVEFHADGSATVIEAKDGARGYGHVASGIGQASLYAVQLAAAKGALTYVRRALMWTSTGHPASDAEICAACVAAGVIPMEWPSMRVLMANEAAVRHVLQGHH